MRATSPSLPRILDALEERYGAVKVRRRGDDAYQLLIYTNCGYPASEDACDKGFAALKATVGVSPQAIARATKPKLVAAMRKGGIVPELRAGRLREIAETTIELGGDLRGLLMQPLAVARRQLKKFPTIGDPGADKILLFTRTAPIAAVPSNATQVPLRLGFGDDGGSYAAGYRTARAALDDALPETFEARIRAYTLLKQHGQQVCKRARPACDQCPVTAECAYFRRTR